MGLCAIREVLRLPETDLVSVLAYNKTKHGVDVGTLIGANPVNVRVTTDFKELIAAKPDVVLHTAQFYPSFSSDDEIEMLLEAGLNIITCLPYQYPLSRGAAVAKRFDDAAKRGGATLFGTGINPGFIFERLAAVMTGISNDIQSIRLDEYVCSQDKPSGEILGLFGYGMTLEEIEKNTTVAMLAETYLAMGMRYLADKLGMPLDRIERTSHHQAVDRDIVLPIFVARKGTVGIVSFKWTGYAHGKPMIVTQAHWYLHESLRPAEAKGDDYWLLQIEGQPSTRLGLEIQGSFEKNLNVLPNNPTTGAWFATVIAMIQAIPMVIDAAPGQLLPAMPQVHWKPDMRAGHDE